MMDDLIADALTRIRNAAMRRLESCNIITLKHSCWSNECTFTKRVYRWIQSY